MRVFYKWSSDISYLPRTVSQFGPVETILTIRILSRRRGYE